jgi:hypothetical protein
VWRFAPHQRNRQLTIPDLLALRPGYMHATCSHAAFRLHLADH